MDVCVRACRSELLSTPPRSADVHVLPDARAGEGLQVQSLPVAQSAHRDVAPAVADRAPDQDLVPEPAHEGEARAAGDSRTERERSG